MNPNTPLTATEDIIALGRVSEASLISSAEKVSKSHHSQGVVRLTHVDRAVIAQHRRNSGGETHQCRRSSVIPTTTIVKGGEDSTRVISRCQYPQWNDNHKEANDMDDQDQPFHKWQVLCQERVEHDGKGRNGNHQHRAMPALEIIIWLV